MRNSSIFNRISSVGSYCFEPRIVSILQNSDRVVITDWLFVLYFMLLLCLFLLVMNNGEFVDDNVVETCENRIGTMTVSLLYWKIPWLERYIRQTTHFYCFAYNFLIWNDLVTYNWCHPFECDFPIENGTPTRQFFNSNSLQLSISKTLNAFFNREKYGKATENPSSHSVQN